MAFVLNNRKSIHDILVGTSFKKCISLINILENIKENKKYNLKDVSSKSKRLNSSSWTQAGYQNKQMSRET